MNTNDLHEKFDAHVVQESDEAIEKLGDQVYTLEENDKLRGKFDHVREDDITEKERLEALSAALENVSAISF